MSIFDNKYSLRRVFDSKKDLRSVSDNFDSEYVFVNCDMFGKSGVSISDNKTYLRSQQCLNSGLFYYLLDLTQNNVIIFQACVLTRLRACSTWR
jgi:hypothetical protein